MTTDARSTDAATDGDAEVEERDVDTSDASDAERDGSTSDGGAAVAWPPSDFGPPGWGTSEEPLCREERAVTGDLVLEFAGDELVLVAVPFETRGRSLEVWSHDRSGWSMMDTLEWRGGSGSTHVVTSGASLLFSSYAGALRIWPVSDRVERFDVPQGINGMAAGSGDRVVALVERSPGLVELVDGQWQPVTGDAMPLEPRDFRAIALDGSVAYVGGTNGTLLRNEDGAWTILPTGSVATIAGLAVRVPGEILVATANEQLLAHRDGATTTVWDGSGRACPSNVTDFWVDAGTAYFVAGSVFGRVDDNGLTILADLAPRDATSCTGAIQLWTVTGEPGGDVFLLGAEVSQAAPGCEERVIRWDGELFHWM